MAKNNSDNNKENKKSLIKKILAAFVAIDIIVGVVFLICYFKGCGPFNKNTSSMSSAIDTTDYSVVDTNLKHIVEHQMELDGFEDEPIQSIVALSYEERYRDNRFDLMISAISSSYLYNLKVEGVQYKEGTDTLVSYLLCNNEIEGATNLYREQITGEHVIVHNGRYIISVPISGTDEHKTGYELIDNKFQVRQPLFFKGNNTSESNGYQILTFEEGQPLYNYYKFLLNR